MYIDLYIYGIAIATWLCDFMSWKYGTNHCATYCYSLTFVIQSKPILFQSELMASLSLSHESTEKCKRLECLTELLRFLVGYKGGYLVPRPPSDFCRQLVVPLLQQMSEENGSDMVPAYVLLSFQSSPYGWPKPQLSIFPRLTLTITAG